MKELWHAYELWVRRSKERERWITFTTPAWAPFLIDDDSQPSADGDYAPRSLTSERATGHVGSPRETKPSLIVSHRPKSL
jgi:hypothetical protein